MKLRYLHISDLHLTSPKEAPSYREASQFEQELVTGSMLDAIDALMRESKGLDLILVTGDLARHGRAEEYRIVEAFCERLLEVTNMPASRLHLVPGNHDVDRDKVARSHVRWWYDFSDAGQITDVVTSTDAFPVLMGKLSAFNEFANRVAERHLYDEKHYYVVEAPSFQENREAFCLNIVSLNSALFAGYNGADNGKLALGLPQLDGAIRQLDSNASLTVVLMHHPPQCFHPADKVCLNQLLSTADVILTGHQHEPANAFVRNAAGQAVIISAGASLSKRESENSFNLVEVDLQSGVGVVQFYKYLPAHNRWVKNTDANPGHEEGAFVFELEAIRERALSKRGNFAGATYAPSGGTPESTTVEVDLLDAVYAELWSSGTPLHYKAIARLVSQHWGYAATANLPRRVYRRIMQETKKPDGMSPFEKVAPGVFGIAPNAMLIHLQITGASREFCHRLPKAGERYFPIGARLIVPREWMALVGSYDHDLGAFSEGHYHLNSTTLTLPEAPALPLDRFGRSFKGHIHFVRIGEFPFLWGTPEHIILPDPDLQVVAIGGHGDALMRISDVEAFLTTVRASGVEQVTYRLARLLVRAFTRVVCGSYKSTRDLAILYAANDRLCEDATEASTSLGIEVVHAAIQGVAINPYVPSAEAGQPSDAAE